MALAERAAIAEPGGLSLSARLDIGSVNDAPTLSLTNHIVAVGFENLRAFLSVHSVAGALAHEAGRRCSVL